MKCDDQRKNLNDVSNLVGKACNWKVSRALVTNSDEAMTTIADEEEDSSSTIDFDGIGVMKPEYWQVFRLLNDENATKRVNGCGGSIRAG